MSGECFENGGEEEERRVGSGKKSNVLPLWGNERSMNLNPLILTNIQSSHYFKVNLYELKTYHEVIDEIYYKVAHLEPWEKGSRKTSGQTGMCGGVRGVGAGGIVSTAYCLLYKLFTLKLTRKQLNGLISHPDSPYIRALGFMYIRYTQPPADLWEWYDEYLEDTEELDVKAGGGQVMTMGAILRSFLSKLEWFSTLFPRIPVPIQQKIEKNLNAKFGNQKPVATVNKSREPGEQERLTTRYRERSRERDRREPERRDTTDRWEPDRRETDRRENERRDSDRRENDRRESDRRDNDRRELDRRDNDRSRETDSDRREPERRDGERKCRREAERNGSRNHDRYLDRDRHSEREYVRSSDSSRTSRDHRERRSRERERHRSRSRDRHRSKVY